MTALVFDRVEIGMPDACWRWLGHHNADGYPLVYVRGLAVVRRVHRLVFELVNGTVGSDTHIHHRCENRWCVNPLHLEAHTPATHRRVHRKCPHSDAERRPRSGRASRHSRCLICEGERYRERMATDPEYAARQRAYHTERERLRREKYRDAIRAADRERYHRKKVAA